MFSFFKKTLAVAAPTAEVSSAQITDKHESTSGIIPTEPTENTGASTPSLGNLSGLAQAQLQLRTPSPSALPNLEQPTRTDERSSALGTSSTLADATAGDNMRKVESSTASRHLEPTPEALDTLIKSIPSKTLHSYVLTHLAKADEDTLRALAAFFEELTPPPKLHCVRCHKDYTEVENDDRSCLVPHDDESAEVERVGLTVDGRRTSETTSSSYQTLWGCCGKVTEGDGSHGPPDGWCYEGRHTTDIKRARFRADSTPQDDKLVSCLRLNCHSIRDTLPHTRSRGRVRADYKEETSDDESEGASDSGMEEITGQKSGMKGRKKAPASKSSKSKSKGKDKDKDAEGEGEAMDVDRSSVVDSASKAGSGRGKGLKAEVQTDNASAAGSPAAPPAKKPRGRPRKPAPAPPETRSSNAAGSTAESHASAPKRPRGRPRKSTAVQLRPQTTGATLSLEQQPVVVSASASASTPISLSPPKKIPEDPLDTPSASKPMVMIQQSGNLGPVLMLTPQVPQGAQVASISTAPPPSQKPLFTAQASSGRKRRAPKSKEFVEDSDIEMVEGHASVEGAQSKDIGGAGAREGAPRKKRKI